MQCLIKLFPIILEMNRNSLYERKDLIIASNMERVITMCQSALLSTVYIIGSFNLH